LGRLEQAQVVADAQQLIQRGQISRARTMLARSLERDPGDGPTAALLIRCQLMLDEWPQALELAESWRERWGEATPAEFLGLVARCRLRAGRIALAERAADSCLLNAPDNGDALLVKGVTAGIRGESQAAATFLTDAVARDPRWAEARLELAQVLGDLEDYPAAANQYQQHLTLDDPSLRAQLLRVGQQGLAQLLRDAGTSAPARFTPPVEPLALPAKFCGSAIIVRVGIGQLGVLPLLLDTGGSCAISLDTAAARGSVPGTAIEMEILGLSGRAPVTAFWLDNITIGGADINRLMVMTMDFDGILDSYTCPTTGILGTGWLRDATLVIDVTGERVLFAPPEQALRALDAVTGPVYTVGDGKILLDAVVAGRPCLALLDTGADCDLISVHLAQALAPLSGQQEDGIDLTGIGDGGCAQAWELGMAIEMDWFGLRYTLERPIVFTQLDHMLSPLLGVQVDAVLGMPFILAQQRLEINAHSRRLSVVPPTGYNSGRRQL